MMATNRDNKKGTTIGAASFIPANEMTKAEKYNAVRPAVETLTMFIFP